MVQIENPNMGIGAPADLVDVLESGKDTEGGFSNIHTKARKEGGMRGDKE